MGCPFWRLRASCFTGGWSGSCSAHTVVSFFITLWQKKEKEINLFHIHRWSKFLPKLNYFFPTSFSLMFCWRLSLNVCIILQTNVMEQNFLWWRQQKKQGHGLRKYSEKSTILSEHLLMLCCLNKSFYSCISTCCFKHFSFQFSQPEIIILVLCSAFSQVGQNGGSQILIIIQSEQPNLLF